MRVPSTLWGGNSEGEEFSARPKHQPSETDTEFFHYGSTPLYTFLSSYRLLHNEALFIPFHLSKFLRACQARLHLAQMCYESNSRCFHTGYFDHSPLLFPIPIPSKIAQSHNHKFSCSDLKDHSFKDCFSRKSCDEGGVFEQGSSLHSALGGEVCWKHLPWGVRISIQNPPSPSWHSRTLR